MLPVRGNGLKSKNLCRNPGVLHKFAWFGCRVLPDKPRMSLKNRWKMDFGTSLAPKFVSKSRCFTKKQFR